MTSSTEPWQAAYERDIQTLHHSGPHALDDTHREKNRAVRALVEDLMPLADAHKAGDCDLLYRFLIGRKWDVSAAAASVRDYIRFRAEHRLDSILWETFPADLLQIAALYKGFDREGHPIYYDTPDPKLLGQMLAAHPKEAIMRVHLRMMEEGRRLQVTCGADRVTCVINFQQMNMAIVTNPSAVRFMKEIAHVDQQHYPENMRFMLICNGGWTFSTAYKMLKPLLDPRVQMKIHFMSGGEQLFTDVDRFVEPGQRPPSFRGTLPETAFLLDYSALRLLPEGTRPQPRSQENPVLRALHAAANAASSTTAAPAGADGVNSEAPKNGSFVIDDSGMQVGSPLRPDGPPPAGYEE